MTWSICIFAYNEERLLPRCLAALDGAAAGGDYVVHVMENGSTDDTARVAHAIASADNRIKVHECALGDKANAWNDYVHRIAGAAEMHIFIDGDIQPCKGAFQSLNLALKSSPSAYAAAGVPASGRSRRAWATRLFTERYLSGNLYAMSGDAVDIFRRRDIRLPVGAVGEDGLLTYLLVTDLEGGEDDSHRERIAVAGGAFFQFDSLGPTLRDLQLYRRRLQRYSQRYFQNQALYALLKAKGIDAMPERIDRIFTQSAVQTFRPRLGAVNLLVDLETIARLKKLSAKAACR